MVLRLQVLTVLSTSTNLRVAQSSRHKHLLEARPPEPP